MIKALAVLLCIALGAGHTTGGGGDDLVCRGPSECGCEAGEFCNFDDGVTGGCEECREEGGPWQECDDRDLEDDEGVDDCTACCRDTPRDLIDFGPIDTVFELWNPDVPSEAAAAKEKCVISDAAIQELKDMHYDKIMCPFQVLVVGSDLVPKNNLKFAANTIAELLDQDGDGVPDVPAVQEALRTGSPTAPVLACGANEDEEDELDSDPLASAYVYGCQSYGRDLQDAQNTIFHESHHLVHQQGWAFVWPEKFGYISFFADDDENMEKYYDEADGGDWDTSTVCAATASLQCVSPGWMHPENRCPTPDCSSATKTECDVEKHLEYLTFSGSPGECEECDLRDDDNITPLCDDRGLEPAGVEECKACCGDERLPGDPAPSPLECLDDDEPCCNTPDCDCVEFHRSAGLTYVGQYDKYSYDYFGMAPHMPKDSGGVKEMLEKCCPDYVAILEDRTYGQVYKPLTGTYCPACGPDKPCPTGQTCSNSGPGRKLRFGYSGGGGGCCILDTP